MRAGWLGWSVGLGSIVGCIMGCGGPARSSQAGQPALLAGQATGPHASTSQAWDELVQEYIEQSFERDPGFAVSQGRHDFDGKLADLSQAGLRQTVEQLTSQRARALAFGAQELDPVRAFEREYLLANADGALFWLTRAKDPQRNPLFYSSAVDPSVYVTRNYAPLERRMKACAAQLRGVPGVLRAMRDNLVAPLPRTHLAVASEVYGGLISYIDKDVQQIFGVSGDTALKAELAAASQEAVAALRETLAYLDVEKARASDDFALGPDLFREMLWATERVDTPLDRLAEIGNHDLERNLEALQSACETLAPGKSLADCAAIVNADKPAAGPVAEARVQLVQLKQFVAARELVTIPGVEEALVEEAPPHKRWNQAFIDIPGPYDIGQPSIYYIAPPDPKWSEAERMAYLPGVADLLFISVHEVWPGHFLQFLHANRSERMLGRLFVGYAFAEGWAHYTEELMWEAGLSADPKVHVGQLLNALLRNVRFMSAIGLHTQNMSVAESERLFLEKALQDPGNAKQQAARGTFDPGYLNYTLGKLIIRQLRDDWTASRGGRSAYREFHDKLLSFGGPPLPLVRNAMLGAPSAPL
ncbi:MAG: DUF885 domain-containing protein [Myxococcales bacterium]